MPILRDPKAAGHAAIGYQGGSHTIRDDHWRMIRHRDGHVELYDHASPEKETLNVADKYPEVIAKLSAQLEARLTKIGEQK